MEITLKKANIVILAEAHNPSIISPEWLKKNSVITEEPTQFVHTPPFSMFESSTFLLVVEQNRWEISTKKSSDKESLKALSEVAKKYVELLTHIPYRSLGLNLVWTIKRSKEEELPKINLQLGNIRFDTIITGHELNYGGIIYAKSPPYLLKLTIEKLDSDSIIVYSFNYHHDIKDIPPPEIKNFLDSFINRYEDSQKIIKKLYS